MSCTELESNGRLLWTHCWTIRLWNNRNFLITWITVWCSRGPCINELRFTKLQHVYLYVVYLQ